MLSFCEEEPATMPATVYLNVIVFRGSMVPWGCRSRSPSKKIRGRTILSSLVLQEEKHKMAEDKWETNLKSFLREHQYSKSRDWGFATHGCGYCKAAEEFSDSMEGCRLEGHSFLGGGGFGRVFRGDQIPCPSLSRPRAATPPISPPAQRAQEVIEDSWGPVSAAWGRSVSMGGLVGSSVGSVSPFCTPRAPGRSSSQAPAGSLKSVALKRIQVRDGKGWGK